MGTRSLICVVYKGEFVIAQYSEFDGYPEGQGAKIFNFLSYPDNIRYLKDGLKHTYTPSEAELKEINQNIEKLDQQAFEEACQQDVFQDIYSYGKSSLTKYWPSLSPEAGARILYIIAQPQRRPPIRRIPILKELEFANATVFCEWVYVVDLDTQVFEVFHGSQRKAIAFSRRFNDVGDERATVPKLLKYFPLDKLPASKQDFLQSLEPIEN
jgi:hypothetical protein